MQQFEEEAKRQLQAATATVMVAQFAVMTWSDVGLALQGTNKPGELWDAFLASTKETAKNAKAFEVPASQARSVATRTDAPTAAWGPPMWHEVTTAGPPVGAPVSVAGGSDTRMAAHAGPGRNRGSRLGGPGARPAGVEMSQATGHTGGRTPRYALAFAKAKARFPTADGCLGCLVMGEQNNGQHSKFADCPWRDKAAELLGVK